jgi:hypothetical protein
MYTGVNKKRTIFPVVDNCKILLPIALKLEVGDIATEREAS